jgi:hypothetical protein
LKSMTKPEPQTPGTRTIKSEYRESVFPTVGNVQKHTIGFPVINDFLLMAFLYYRMSDLTIDVGECRRTSEYVGECRRMSEDVGGSRRMSEIVGKFPPTFPPTLTINSDSHDYGLYAYISAHRAFFRHLRLTGYDSRMSEDVGECR